jgi:hypothetical protein
MNSTPLFVEILVIGIQALIWIAMLVFPRIDHNWATDFIPTLKDWIPVITIFLLGISYTLGIIIDRIADACFELLKPTDLLIKSKANNLLNRCTNIDGDEKRMEIYGMEEKRVTLIEYIRSRIRIIRSTTLNIVLITIASIPIVTTSSIFSALDGVIIYALAIIIIALCILTQVLLEITYVKRVAQIKLNKNN